MNPATRFPAVRRLAAALALIAVAGCVATAPMPPGTMPRTMPGPSPVPAAPVPPRPDPATAAATFGAVVARLEPVAEAECRARAPRLPCDFTIAVDTRPGLGINAYQTLDAAGRPVIAFTPGLIAEARNADELAFVLGHEAAHHILGHIPRQGQTSLAGALVLGALAAAGGAAPGTVRTAQDLGAAVGARTFSKDFELEADALGARIAEAAGYDALAGIGFFTRLPDPGNRFLGSHPPNGQRIAVVRAAVGARP